MSVPVSILLCTSAAHAQWTENFDAYTGAGALLHTQSTWELWSTGAEGWVEDNTTLPAGITARSGPNVVAIGQARGLTSTLETDLIQRYHSTTTPYDSGLWEYRTWQYVPSTMSGTTYFILLNTYNPGGAIQYNWSVQVEFNATPAAGFPNGTVQGDCGASNNWNVHLEPDAWVEIRVVINLDNDWCQVFYGDQEPSPQYSWSAGVFGQNNGGVTEIGAVDLYGNTGTDVYYDDMSLDSITWAELGGNPAGSQGQLAWAELLPASAATGSWIMQYDNMPHAAHFVIMGLNNTASPAGNLPLDLTPFGITNHFLRVANEAVLFQLGAPSGPNTFMGASSWSVGPAYIGLSLHLQILYLDPGANPLGAGLSSAIYTVITP